ncbi:Acyl-CoA thioesterase FadM [Chitinophaga sp. CF118]|uniref:acyl-CoA thioesterase n=1 Tax=Chitinophaga sp. CF118 TaxID=1884367 RepID=UPI0008EC1381|nr:acyl-CoA thioesterase [Chitinophaga sp. CF118]SFD49979.1 Acyl-CoA thioesterase FadM [Chitinophaga sp. CF118]
MLLYWYNVIRILLLRYVKKRLDVNEPFIKEFRVKTLDCDALRVMAAYKYFVYMDYARWEQFIRTDLYTAVLTRKLAPSLGSQKIIYRKPIKRGTRVSMHVEIAGWDNRWFYHVHTFMQNNEVKAIGVTKGLFWRKDKLNTLEEIVHSAGFSNIKKDPPDWVLQLFENDGQIISSMAPATHETILIPETEMCPK